MGNPHVVLQVIPFPEFPPTGFTAMLQNSQRDGLDMLPEYPTSFISLPAGPAGFFLANAIRVFGTAPSMFGDTSFCRVEVPTVLTFKPDSEVDFLVVLGGGLPAAKQLPTSDALPLLRFLAEFEWLKATWLPELWVEDFALSLVEPECGPVSVNIPAVWQARIRHALVLPLPVDLQGAAAREPLAATRLRALEGLHSFVTQVDVALESVLISKNLVAQGTGSRVLPVPRWGGVMDGDLVPAEVPRVTKNLATICTRDFVAPLAIFGTWTGLFRFLFVRAPLLSFWWWWVLWSFDSFQFDGTDFDFHS